MLNIPWARNDNGSRCSASHQPRGLNLEFLQQQFTLSRSRKEMGKIDISNPVFFPVVNKRPHDLSSSAKPRSVRSFRPRTSRLLIPGGWTGHWPSPPSCGASTRGPERNLSGGRAAITPASPFLTLLRATGMSASTDYDATIPIWKRIPVAS